MLFLLQWGRALVALNKCRSPLSSLWISSFCYPVVGTCSLGTYTASTLFFFSILSLLSPSPPYTGPLVIPVRMRGEALGNCSSSGSLNVTPPLIHRRVIKVGWRMFLEKFSLT